MLVKKTAAKARKRREIEDEDIISAMTKNYQKIDFRFKKRDFKFTPKQKELLDILNNPDNKVIIIEGPAGVSKTLCAVYAGLTDLKDDKYEKFIYIRSVIESGHKSLGYLPGSLDEKLLMWRAPLDDKINELVEPKDVHKLAGSDKIEVLPINYIRGASWRNSYVVFDEFQNTLLGEAKTLMTRIGEGSKLILCGDADQADIKESGFRTILDAFKGEDAKKNGIVTFRFSENDIVRSEIVKFIVKKFKDLE